MCNSSSPFLLRVEFSSNSAVRGGGMKCDHSSSPTLQEVEFLFNTAVNSGGMDCYINSSPTLEDVLFLGNEATTMGAGGLDCTSNSSPTLTRVVFDSNTADDYGGGVYCCNGSCPVFSEAVFVGNSANRGGAIECYNASPEFTRTTLWMNSCDPSSGVIGCFAGSSPVLTNTIVSSSTGGFAIVCSDSAEPSLTRCCVYDNACGDSLCGDYHDNLFVNPLFCDAESGDFTLRDDSQCLPENNPWGELIGTYGPGDCATGVPEDPEQMPTTLALYPASPNPSSRATSIAFDLPAPQTISLMVFDVAGRRVRTLAEDMHLPAGRRTVSWDGLDDTGSAVASGVYFYRLVAGEEELTGRVVLLR